MRRIGCLLFFFILTFHILAQSGNVQVKVYEFEEGLSHRITSKVLQGKNGYIWIGTINGLNRFDGYEFTTFNNQKKEHYIPHSVVSDLILTSESSLWIGCPDHLVHFNVNNETAQSIKIKEGPSVARESIIPYNLFEGSNGLLWSAAYDEQTATTRLLKIDPTSGAYQSIYELEGAYPQRPIVQLGSHLYLGASDNEIWQLDIEGKFVKKYELPLKKDDRVTQMAISGQTLYALSVNGQLYTLSENEAAFQFHPASFPAETATALMVEPNGDLWLGGRGVLLFYEASTQSVSNYAPNIQDIVKNTCTYRQIYRDRSGVVWVASDFGAIKLVQGEQLFTQYLQGGNENCSNVFCSTRGITEDNNGNIYISYYSSIHVLNPASNSLRPLFPAKNFFNAPFGLTYYEGALWTGNGKRIDLATKKVTDVLGLSEKDLGHVVATPDSTLWMGYLHHLYKYDPYQEILEEFEDNTGKWDSLQGNISYLLPGKTQHGLWVATLGNGVHWIDKYRERTEHYHAGEDSPVVLKHNQVNATV